MATWRYQISLPLLKNISLVRYAHVLLNIFQHFKRNFLSLCGHVISSIYQRLLSFLGW